MKYILAILSVLAAVLAQVLVKSASLNEVYGKKWIILIIASLTAYGIAFVLQTFVFRLFPLSKIGPPSAIAVMIFVFGCGVFFFGESVSLKQYIGLILGASSIYLIMT